MQDWFFERALLPAGMATNVALRSDADGRIVALAADSRPAPAARHGGIALPGLPDLHSHAFQRGMAGLAETRGPGADSFWTWRQVMYRFLDRLGPDEMQAIAALAFLEMLEGGFTRVGEFHYLHHDPDGRPYGDRAEMAARIVAAAAETGIGLTLLPVLYAFSGFGARPAEPAQRRFLNDRDGFAALLEGARRAAAAHPGTIVGVAPHSLRAVDPALLAAVPALAAGGPVHIHIAEQTREVEDCRLWSGTTPVAWLLDAAAVDAGWCLIHATHVTPEEVSGMARAGCVAGLCPITEANLGDGLFPAADFLAAGGRFGVGSDSNVRISAAGELELLEYGQRLIRRQRNVLAGEAGGSTGAAVYRAALSGGAQALGVSGAGLAVGAPADFVLLDADHIALAAADGDSLVDAYLFAAGPAAIDTVVTGGRVVVSGGRHVRRDAILGRARTVLASLTG